MSRPKLFSEIKGQVHDASGIDNPHNHYWVKDGGIYYPIKSPLSNEDVKEEITLEEVKVLLEGILEKINANNISLWHDDLQGASECVILELASIGDDESDDNPRREIEYNGWCGDLINLINKLK